MQAPRLRLASAAGVYRMRIIAPASCELCQHGTSAYVAGLSHDETCSARHAMRGYTLS